MKSVRRTRWGKAFQTEGTAPARRNYREVKKKKHTQKVEHIRSHSLRV